MKNEAKNSTQLSRRYQFMVVAVLAILYFVLSAFLEVEIGASTMFNNYHPDADSYSYLQVGNWLLGGPYTELVSIRPFLFSLEVALLNKIGGAFLIWFFQAGAIIGANFLLFLTIFKLTCNRYQAWTGSLIFALNFSLINVTYHALSEPVVVLGISFIILVSSKRYLNELTDGRYWSQLVLILGILLVVKPVFLLPFLAVLLIVLGRLLLRKMPLSSLKIVPVVVGLFLVVFQVVLMKMTIGEFTISKIGDITLRDYLIAQTISEQEGVDLKLARALLSEMNESPVAYAKDHFGPVLRIFIGNVQNNIQSDSFVVDYGNLQKNALAGSIMKVYNRLLLWVLVFLLFVFPVLFYRSFRNKEPVEWPIYLQYIFLFYLIIVTGIAFAQRDRLILITLPFWISLFMYALSKLKEIRIPGLKNKQ